MRPPNSYQPTVLFPLTVDADLSLTAQSLLRRECGAEIYAIQLEDLNDTHEVRLGITLAATAYGPAVHAVIAGLPAAQFGRVTPVRDAVLPMPMAA